MSFEPAGAFFNDSIIAVSGSYTEAFANESGYPLITENGAISQRFKMGSTWCCFVLSHFRGTARGGTRNRPSFHRRPESDLLENAM